MNRRREMSIFSFTIKYEWFTMVNHGEPWWTMVNHSEPSIFYVERKNLHFSTPVHPFELIPRRFCAICRWDFFQTIKKVYKTSLRDFYVKKKNRHFSTPVHPFELIPVRFCIIFRGDSFKTIKFIFREKYFLKKWLFT